MAVKTTDLVSLAKIKEYIGTSVVASGTGDDAFLESRIAAWSTWIESHCRRVFKETTYTEFHDGDGETGVLFPIAYPIISITNIWDDLDRAFGDTTKIASGDYYIDKYKISVKLVKNTAIYPPSQRPVFSSGVGNVKITYVAGYILQDASVTGSSIALPEVIRDACIKLVTQDYFDRGKGKVGKTSMTDGDTSKGFESGIPKELLEMLEPYRRMNI